jgi:hypothetical protein
MRIGEDLQRSNRPDAIGRILSIKVSNTVYAGLRKGRYPSIGSCLPTVSNGTSPFVQLLVGTQTRSDDCHFVLSIKRPETRLSKGKCAKSRRLDASITLTVLALSSSPFPHLRRRPIWSVRNRISICN